jgi:MoxR-like ATPase
MDGTLLNSQSMISAETLETIKELQKKGIYFTVCTGRIYATARSYVELLEIEGLIVAANGALVVDARTGEIVQKRTVDPGLTEKILKYIGLRGFDSQAALAAGQTPSLQNRTEGPDTKFHDCFKAAQALINGAAKIIRGKREFLELLTAAILAKGHGLIEDNPGLGKTTVAKTMAKLIAAEDGAPLLFKRIQFTPDLLPYDITGVDVFDPESRSFRFIPGPVLANIVLADEINRTTPKVQSALLEVMAERQVTIGSATHHPPLPFLVMATQNPIESEGTFPLPAAQLDRFMMRLSLGYPDREAELSILEENPSEYALNTLEPVISTADFLAAQKAVTEVFCHPDLKAAIADSIRDTRTHKAFLLGASPRAGLHFLEAAKALALVRGRDFVSDEDIAALAPPVLVHRLKLRDPRSQGTKLIREICLARIDGIKTV